MLEKNNNTYFFSRRCAGYTRLMKLDKNALEYINDLNNIQNDDLINLNYFTMKYGIFGI